MIRCLKSYTEEMMQGREKQGRLDFKEGFRVNIPSLLDGRNVWGVGS